MKTFPTFLFILDSIIVCNAQLPLHAWSYSWGSTEYDVTAELAVDAEANVYVAGYFKGTVDFDPGPGSATFTTGLGGFINETYISIYDSSGHFLWVKHISSDIECITQDIVYDPAGYIYVSGYYEGTCDFDPGAGMHSMSSSPGSDDNFILKLDLNGNYVWATSIGGSGDEYGRNIALDDDGNILIAGAFKGSCDFDPGPNQFIISSIAQQSDLFFAKYTSEGDFIWAKAILGSFQGDIRGLGTDHQGNVFITGVFDDRRDFDPGSDSVIVVSTGYWDAFVEKFDASGNYQWVHHLGNDSEAWGLDLAMDDENNVHVTGFFSGALDFDPGTESQVLNATLDDGFVWKLDNDGNLVWVAQLGGESYDEGRAITVDKNGNVYTSGFYAETLDFDPGPDEYNLTSTGNNDNNDAYISKLNKNGEFEWAYTLGGIEDDFSGEAKLDASGNVYITGSFQGKAGFYPEGTATDSLVSNGSYDVFLTRWHQCLETYGGFSVFECYSFTSPSGKYIWTESGIYTDTIRNVAGCDSIITIIVNISDLNLTITQQGNTLHGEGGAGQLYWMDCDHDFAVVSEGDTFTPSSNGNYALGGAGFACSDTSECFAFVMTAIGNLKQDEGFTIYPNPAHNSIQLALNALTSELTITIFNQLGRVVYSNDFGETQFVTISLNVPSGMYTALVQPGNNKYFQKLVITP